MIPNKKRTAIAMTPMKQFKRFKLQLEKYMLAKLPVALIVVELLVNGTTKYVITDQTNTFYWLFWHCELGFGDTYYTLFDSLKETEEYLTDLKKVCR